MNSVSQEKKTLKLDRAVARILVHPEKCVGCLICQLQCSFSKTGLFNPSEAEIMIDLANDEARIVFTDDCDGCGLCAKFCAYGALTFS